MFSFPFISTISWQIPPPLQVKKELFPDIERTQDRTADRARDTTLKRALDMPHDRSPIRAHDDY